MPKRPVSEAARDGGESKPSGLASRPGVRIAGSGAGSRGDAPLDGASWIWAAAADGGAPAPTCFFRRSLRLDAPPGTPVRFLPYAGFGV